MLSQVFFLAGFITNKKDFNIRIFIFSVFLNLLCVGLFAQVPAATLSTPLEKEIHSEKEETGMVVFIRETGDLFAHANLKIFVSDELACRLPNRHFAKIDMQAGTHQLLGKQLKPKTDIIDVDVVAGETKYILLVVTGNDRFTDSLEKLELTEQDALRLLSRSKEHKKF